MRDRALANWPLQLVRPLGQLSNETARLLVGLVQEDVEQRDRDAQRTDHFDLVGVAEAVHCGRCLWRRHVELDTAAQPRHVLETTGLRINERPQRDVSAAPETRPDALQTRRAAPAVGPRPRAG